MKFKKVTNCLVKQIVNLACHFVYWLKNIDFYIYTNVWSNLYVQNALLTLVAKKTENKYQTHYTETHNSIPSLASNCNVPLHRTAYSCFNKVHVHYNILYIMLFKTCTGLATEECLESSFFTHCSLVEPVICHLADAIQMDKSCHHNKDMEYLMALELREKKWKNIKFENQQSY